MVQKRRDFREHCPRLLSLLRCAAGRAGVDADRYARWMHFALSSIVLAIACVVATPTLRGQTPAAVRVTHPGRVLDSERKPASGATVVLVAPDEHGGLLEGDVVRVEADASGRFRAALQPARRYVAWASVERELTFVSPLVEVGADATELTLASAPQPRHLQLVGLEPWKEFGPLRVQIGVHDCASLTCEGDIDAKGRLALPALPSAGYEVRVFCAGKLVHATDGGVHGGLTLPGPHRLRVRVADEKDQPIAGASVERCISRWPRHSGPFPTRPGATRVPLAITADDGTAELIVAADTDPLVSTDYTMLAFVATRDGFRSGVSGRVHHAFCNDKKLSEEQLKSGVLPFTLHVGKPASLRLDSLPGHPVGPARWLGHLHVPYDGNGMTTILDSTPLPIVDGMLTMPHTPTGGSPGTIDVAVDMPALAADDPWSRIARPRVLVLPQSSLQGEQAIDLRDVQPLRLLVLDAAEAPAIAASVVCAPKGNPEFVEAASSMHATTDRTGRTLLLVRPGSWIVAAAHGSSFAHTVIDVKPGHAPLTLKLESLPRMQVVVRDAKGQPIEGATFNTRGSSWGGNSTPEDDWLRPVAWSMTNNMLTRSRTDANGRADLAFLPLEGMQSRLNAQHRGRHVAIPRLEATTEPLEVILP